MTKVVTCEDRHFAEDKSLWEEAFPNDAPWNVAGPCIAESFAFNPT